MDSELGSPGDLGSQFHTLPELSTYHNGSCFFDRTVGSGDDPRNTDQL